MNVCNRAVPDAAGAGATAPEAALGRGCLYAGSDFDAAPACGPEGPSHRDKIPPPRPSCFRCLYARLASSAWNPRDPAPHAAAPLHCPGHQRHRHRDRLFGWCPAGGRHRGHRRVRPGDQHQRRGRGAFAVPATAIVHRYGRRLSLAAGYSTAALGSILLVSAALRNSIPILFLGFFFFGGATAAGLQARYAAVDLAPAAVRGRHLSLVVWATTIGAIIGPSLAPVAGRTVGVYGVPTLAGPFVFSAVLLGLAALLLFGLLRPDPAVVAREQFGASDAASSAGRAGIGEALRLVASLPAARLGVSAMAIGHVVMVGVMTMTPVHIRGAGHGAEYTLRIVGLVLSFHIAGMFAFAPVVGWLTDRIGRRPVIFAGIAILLTALRGGRHRGPRSRAARRRIDAAGSGLVGDDGRWIYLAERRHIGGDASLGTGAFRSNDGACRRDRRRPFRCGGGGLELSHPDAAGSPGHGSPHRSGLPPAPGG